MMKRFQVVRSLVEQCTIAAGVLCLLTWFSAPACGQATASNGPAASDGPATSDARPTKAEQRAADRRANAELRKRLTREQYHVTCEKGTERAFTGEYWDNHRTGVYSCVCCGKPLFDSTAKFESGTGWPSFYQPADGAAVVTAEDRTQGMQRTEVICKHCGAHLGHVFDDGPQPTGLRYCINSASLQFTEQTEQAGKHVQARVGNAATAAHEHPAHEAGLEKATFGSGCFWCGEAVFERLKGVKSVEAGYSGGQLAQPTYEQVSTGATGHAEVFQVTFDPAIVSYTQLLEVFWKTHDPTTLNRQGPDIGTQYRSVIFTHDDTQRKLAEAAKESLDRSGAFRDPIVTEIVPLTAFYPAEAYHQDYFAQHPGERYCAYVIRPKVKKFQKAFADLLERENSTGR